MARVAPRRISSPSRSLPPAAAAGCSLKQGIEVPGLVVRRFCDRPESCRGRGLGRGHTRGGRPVCGAGIDRCRRSVTMRSPEHFLVERPSVTSNSTRNLQTCAVRRYCCTRAARRSFSGQFRRWRRLREPQQFRESRSTEAGFVRLPPSRPPPTRIPRPTTRVRRSAQASSRRRTPEPAIRRTTPAVRFVSLQRLDLHGEDRVDCASSISDELAIVVLGPPVLLPDGSSPRISRSSSPNARFQSPGCLILPSSELEPALLEPVEFLTLHVPSFPHILVPWASFPSISSFQSPISIFIDHLHLSSETLLCHALPLLQLARLTFPSYESRRAALAMH